LFAIALLETGLFPAFAGTIGDLGDNLPQGVADLLGGGDFSTLAGWLETEIFSIVAPFALAGIGIVIAVGGTAGDEEAGILDLVLAHPVRRSSLVLATALAAATAIFATGLALWAGLVIGVRAFTHETLGAGDLAAAILHASSLGLAFAALGLAVGAATGRRATAIGAAVAVLAVGYLVDGLAAAASVGWLRRLTPFYYDSGSDPLRHGVDLAHLAVLLALALLLTAGAVLAFDRRDLRS
jgi:ABC-2 type transport system permease protein